MANPLTTLARLFVPQPEDFQTRSISDYPAFADQLAAIRSSQAQARPWRPAGVNEALGVPSILSAVSLIAGTVGRLSMEAYQYGSLITDRQQIPRLIVRPNPKTTPRVFFRDTAFHLATRGEAWWWVAKRDVDLAPLSLVEVPPWEVMVEVESRATDSTQDDVARAGHGQPRHAAPDLPAGHARACAALGRCSSPAPR